MEEHSGLSSLRQGPRGAVARIARAAGEGHPVLRGILVLGMVGSVLITWPLWQFREAYPAPLHRIDVPDWDFGVAILVSLGLVMLRPRLGLGVLLSVWAVSCVFDELRIQPPLFSPAMLLFFTLRGRGPRLVGWASLSAMWFYAGLHKMLSDVYLENFGQGVVLQAFPNLPLGLIGAICWSIAAGEMALGALLWWPRARKLCAVVAGTLHASMLVILSAISHNEVVWPWAASFTLVTPVLLWHSAPTLREVWSASWIHRLAAVVLLVSPLGVLVDVVNPYLGHNLYAGNSPRAFWIHARSEPESLKFLKPLRCFAPATRRNYLRLFQQACKPGDRLLIEDPRAWARRHGRSKESIHCGEFVE